MIIGTARGLLVAAAVAALAGCAGMKDNMPGWMPGSGSMSVGLSGAEEVPAIKTDAKGSGAFRVKSDGTITGSVSTEGVQGTMAHIHRGAKGVNGPVVVPFPVFDGLPASFNGVDGCVSADPALVDEIRHHPAGFYVNLHTPDFPGGAIRGQLRHR